MKSMHNLMAKFFSFIVMINLVSLASTSYATYFRVRNERRLNYLLDKYDLAVALFYNKNKAQASVKQTFKQLSRGYSYHEAEVAFVSIDVVREDGEAIASEYGVRKTPTLILFQNGRVVLGKDKVPVVATDVKSASDMRVFINKYFGDLIEDELRDKEERERERRRRRHPRQSSFHFRISYGYPYYPYYGYPFGYSLWVSDYLLVILF